MRPTDPPIRAPAVPRERPAPEPRISLADRRVLIVGVGGLGSPAALSLARVGVGTLGLVDGDVVDASNLHRQVIYRAVDIGRRKVAAAAQRLQDLHPTLRIESFDEWLEPTTAADLFRGFDFVVDGTDRIASKFVVNDAAVLAGVAYSHAGVVGFQGQTLTVIPRQSACLRCLFPTPPPDGDVATCQEAGIIGSLAASIAIVQATEAVRVLLGLGSYLANRMLTYDGSTGRWRAVALRRNPACPLCGVNPIIQIVEPAPDTGR